MPQGARVNILTSLHGNVMGIGPNGEFIRNNPRSGIQSAIGQVTKTITAAQALALFATPITLVAAPGTGLILLVSRWGVAKPAGTAYVVDAGDDLSIKWANAAGAKASQDIETTGFLDQATRQTRWAAGSPGNYVDAHENQALVLHLLTSEILTGNTGFTVWLDYEIRPAVFTGI